MDSPRQHTPEIPRSPAPDSITSYELVPGNLDLGYDPYILAVDQGGSLWLCFHLRGTRLPQCFPSQSPNWQRLN